ncbi:ATP-grasp domain-containing protein [Hymenobacter sp. H14-R3]|uniref:ATP-grasp domain-containing protein n=1 Tax=Hymenobacter sp. H14-R3 TaxID=3046308 RepID=UPI0024B954E9|nr:ATP-grasp domain-containing protein [Hymenobacter sp. H14-R3]MDJ0367261.1 ATP-grasp domain-containing protein [Hymenobacter sp. H14-R3]
MSVSSSLPPVHWVVQHNLLPPATLAAFRQAFAQHRISYEEVLAVPFSPELPALQNPAACCVFYGATTLIMNAYHSARYAAGVCYDAATFTMANYEAQWGPRLLNHGAAIETLGRFVARPHAAASQWFVRPNDDTKTFAGQVLSFAQLQAWHQQLAQVPGAEPGPRAQLVFAAPRAIEKEWRHVVVGGRVVTTTRYQWRGEPRISATDVPAGLLAFVADCCATYQPHGVFVLDTARTDGHYFIVECNCFNGTGFYQLADIAPAVVAVTAWRAQNPA